MREIITALGIICISTKIKDQHIYHFHVYKVYVYRKTDRTKQKKSIALKEKRPTRRRASTNQSFPRSSCRWHFSFPRRFNSLFLPRNQPRLLSLSLPLSFRRAKYCSRAHTCIYICIVASSVCFCVFSQCFRYTR